MPRRRGTGESGRRAFRSRWRVKVENQTSLEDLLSDKDLDAEPKESEPNPEPGVDPDPKEPEEPKDPAEPEPKEPEPGSPPEPKEPNKDPDEEGPESWTKAAVLDERRKRQALEAELEKVRQGQQQQPANEVDKPDWYSDPEKAAQAMQQQVSQQAFNTKLELSQDMMRGQFEDYDELETEFVDLAKQDPRLIQEMQQAANPARFAYETAKKAREYTAMKDVDSYKAKLKQEVEAELRKEMEAEQQQKAEKQQRKRDAIDPSLASSTSNGLKSDDYAGPTPLDNILNG